MPATQKSVQDEYGRIAARYDERWAEYVNGTTVRTLEHLRPRSGEVILDVGCGTGALLRALLARQPQARAVGSAYHRIYGAAECRTLVESAGFAVESLVRYKVSWRWGMMTLVARVRAV